MARGYGGFGCGGIGGGFIWIIIIMIFKMPINPAIKGLNSICLSKIAR